jgi:hypothetical protein
MFGLFKRTKVKQWEIELLKYVGKELPSEYSFVAKQVEKGLIKGVLVGLSDIPNYVGFTYHSDVYNQFQDDKAANYIIRNIWVFDNSKGEYTPCEIYVSSGVVNGYSTPKSKNFSPNVDKINIENYQRAYVNNADFEKIRGLIDEEELALIRPDEVYQVDLKGHTYFHIKDIDDGDFIGIDDQKNVYKITHDPYEIVLLTTDLSDSLKNVGLV